MRSRKPILISQFSDRVNIYLFTSLITAPVGQFFGERAVKRCRNQTRQVFDNYREYTRGKPHCEEYVT